VGQRHHLSRLSLILNLPETQRLFYINSKAHDDLVCASHRVKAYHNTMIVIFDPFKIFENLATGVYYKFGLSSF